MNLKELARKAVSTLFLSMLCLVAFCPFLELGTKHPWKELQRQSL